MFLLTLRVQEKYYKGKIGVFQNDESTTIS